MRPPKPDPGWCRRQAERLGQGALRMVKALPAALTSHRFAVSILLAVVVLELTILGVGGVRRMEMAAKDSERAAMLELAVLEAQTFAHERTTKTGVASIGNAPPARHAREDDADAPPPLRPRDVETILAQDTDDWINNWVNETAIEDTDAKPGNDAGGTGEGDSDEIALFVKRGVASFIAGDMRKCILSLEQARAINPEHPAALYYLGMAYDKLLNPNKALVYYTQVFNLRDKAGEYFQRASKRLSYGVDKPSDMRGKLAFGPYRVNHTLKDDGGEQVDILLPVLLAPGETLQPDGIYVRIIFFDLVDKRRIEFAHADPVINWQNDPQDWKDGEENIVVTYAAPAPTPEEKSIYGDVSYYGFVAKLYYKGEPLDCISTPSALILHEQRLENRTSGRNKAPQKSLLPEEDLEEAAPFSDFIEELNEPNP